MANSKIFLRNIFVILAYIDILILLYSQGHAQPVNELSHFTISDIGNPTTGIAGEVNVGESIANVIITARNANADRIPDYDGMVFLVEQTEGGKGRIEPESVQLVNGEWQGSLTLFRSGKKSNTFGVTGDVWIEVTDGATNPHFGTSNFFTARPADFTRLLTVLPGEEYLPGSLKGRTGEPYFQEIGSEVKVKVIAADAYWNQVKRIDDTIRITSSDGAAVLSPNKTMRKSEVHMPVTLNTEGPQTVTVFDVNRTDIAAHTSSEIVLVVNIPDSVTHFVFDTITGPIVAGDSIQVTARAVDENDLLVASYNQQGVLSASTGPGTLNIGTVVFSNGIWTGYVAVTKSDPAVTLTLQEAIGSAVGTSNAFDNVPGQVASLLILLPGEEPLPGVQPGKSGQPALRFVDELFDIQVRAVDRWWNPTEAGNLSLSFASGDPEATLPGNLTQNTAQADYTVSFRRQGHNQLSVSVSGHPNLTTYMSSLFFIDAGLIDRFTFSEIDSVQIAGEPFFVRIEALNSEGVRVVNYNENVLLAASTGPGTISTTGVALTNGFWEGNLYVTKADSDAVLFVADLVTPPNTHNGTSNPFAIRSNSRTALQVLLPGQTATPGIGPGFDGGAATQVAGDSVNVGVRLVDPYWNTVPGSQDGFVVMVSDSFAAMPDTVFLDDGLANFAVVFRSAGDHQIQITPFDAFDLVSQSSDVVNVIPGPFARLVTLLPGEELLPGDTTTDPNAGPGKMGTRVVQTVGIPFQVRVRATDAFFNPISAGPADLVGLFVTDAQATISPTETPLSGGAAVFDVTLRQGGNQVLRATDLSDGQIQESRDNVVEVLAGGLHYLFSISTDSVTAGEPFDMQLSYRDGIGATVVTANHVVHVSVVSAADPAAEAATISVPSFNLENGVRSLTESIDLAGFYRLRLDDDLGTAPALSEPLAVVPGPVATVALSRGQSEVGALEETTIEARLTDRVGNAIVGESILFEILLGNGSLSESEVVSGAGGVASVVFRGGRVTETNTIQASAESVSATIDVVVNLTKSDFTDGQVVNYPNPFGMESPVTRIDYYLAENADVDLRIFDLFGNLVWSRKISAGLVGARGRSGNVHPNSIEWAGVNNRGQEVGNGGYILVARAVANGKQIMNKKRKIVVLR